MTVLAYVLIIAIVGAFVGSATALLTNWVRAEAARFDAGTARVRAQVDADRAHRSDGHRYVNGRCPICGLRKSFTELYDQEGAL